MPKCLSSIFMPAGCWSVPLISVVTNFVFTSFLIFRKKTRAGPCRILLIHAQTAQQTSAQTIPERTINQSRRTKVTLTRVKRIPDGGGYQNSITSLLIIYSSLTPVRDSVPLDSRASNPLEAVNSLYESSLEKVLGIAIGAFRRNEVGGAEILGVPAKLVQHFASG